ncbi:hypothetical protein OIU83_17635 [Flavobacterium sp. LS1R49]|uniref:Integrase catalytic domain-containing protein n=1 Tax=Flavobacterium shii TaxID=2987687 RepID=A0A9X3C6D2_9FLAO|nr:hypothetical protein [Flavobacterium shii]MCV9929487.1 hypothetical protein [Flavobacterium shii]
MDKEIPYEYYDKKLGVKIKFLISDLDRKHPDSLSLIKYITLYKRMKSNNSTVTELRRSCFGSDALVLFSSLDRETKDAVIFKFGKPAVEVEKSYFSQHYQPDRLAYDFFIDHRYGEDEKKLDLKKVELYTYNASVLNTVLIMKPTRKQDIKARGATEIDIWQSLSNDVNAFREVEHNLPTNKDSLRRKVVQYSKEGYECLISGKYDMKNAQVVTKKIESLLVSLYCLPNKPDVGAVHDLYLQFLGGGIDVVNIKTGELYERKEFFKNDAPIELSVATIWNYLNAPRNSLVIKKARNGAYDFSHKNRPHVNRTAPNYTMSKITLDDRDIMHTKMHDGSKVMAYYAFDDLSGAMIGIAHSKSKNHQLYIDCIRSMFRFTTSKGLGIPMQMEVEQHLVSDFKDGLMQAGNMFPFVRWCNPTNSQEKYAERLIGTKKYGVEKDNNQNVGRHYSRRDSNRVTLQKIFDEQNDNYKDAKASFEQIVANELQEQLQYNNELHPNKEKYNGMTRMDVFLQNINPDLPKLDKGQLAKYIGNRTDTSIRRSQYVTVQYQKYQLESPQILNRLAPNNYDVEAYYIPNDSNEINEVYLYQNNQYVGECKPVPTFNRANAEWTDADKKGYEEATKYISQFDKMVKEDTGNVLEKLSIIKTNYSFIDVTPEIVTDIEHEEVFELEYMDIQTERSRAINDL